MKKAITWFAAGVGSVCLAAAGLLAWGFLQDTDDYTNWPTVTSSLPGARNTDAVLALYLHEC